jgi:3-phosphoshikimate 1-carboxyvinyltransferase
MGARVTVDDIGASVSSPGAELLPLAADLTLMPDAAMTLAAACCFASGRSVIAGLRTLRVKETDRLAALVAELSKVGVRATISRAKRPSGAEDEALCVETPEGGIDCAPGVAPVEFDTYHDHRMAMSMALIGLRRPNVFIRDPGCVAKTYPTFWHDLSRLYGTDL